MFLLTIITFILDRLLDFMKVVENVTNMLENWFICFGCKTKLKLDMTKALFDAKLMEASLLALAFVILFNLVGLSKPFSNPSYVYPLPNTKMHSINTPIVVRFTEKVDKEIIHQIEILGSKSGAKQFEAKVSSDGRTISITTLTPFEKNEKVNVKISDYRFSFETGGLTPAEQQELFIKHFSDKYPEISNALKIAKDFKVTGDKPLNDTVPSDFPNIIINSVRNPSEGCFYFANFGSGIDRSYLIILGNDGKPVKYRKVPVPGFDFKVQPNGLITNARIISSYIPQGWGWATCYMEIMNENLNVLDTLYARGGYIADFHDFIMLPNGHYLLQIYDPQPIDMSQIIEGGDPNAIALGSIVQELDADRNVVFQWRSWDHIPLEDTYEPLTGVALDPVHINAVELDYDGHILISSRHISEITKINRETGEIIWRLGGKKNMFKFINEHEENAPTYFSYQHDIRRLPNGNVTLYDNGVQHEPKYSRAVEYKLDEKNLTAELVWEYRNQPDVYGETMGSTQRLPNGNTIIGWGGVIGDFYRIITEVNPQAEVEFEMSLPKGFAFTTTTYRAYKFPYPPGLPDVDVKYINIKNYLSEQNNSTEFANEQGTTGVTITFDNYNIIDLAKDDFVRVVKYSYAPLYPRFEGSTPLVNQYKVLIYSDNISDFAGSITFDLTKFPNLKHKKNLIIWRRGNPNSKFYPLPSEYNEELQKISCIPDTLDGEYIIATGDFQSPPSKPFLTNPYNNSILNKNDLIRFMWTPSGLHRYSELQISETPEFDVLVYRRDSLKVPYFLLSQLPSNKTYFWRVRCKNEYGISQWSETYSFTLKDPFLRLISPNGGETWEKGKKYLIQWEHNLQNSFMITLYLDGKPVNNISDSIYSYFGKYYWEVPSYLASSDKYKIRVTVYGDNTRYSESETFFTITEPSYVASQANDIVVFPNPFDNQINILFDDLTDLDGKINISLYNSFGIRIQEISNNNLSNRTITLTANNLNPGVYFLEIIGNNFKKRIKVLKL